MRLVPIGLEISYADDYDYDILFTSFLPNTKQNKKCLKLLNKCSTRIKAKNTPASHQVVRHLSCLKLMPNPPLI